MRGANRGLEPNRMAESSNPEQPELNKLRAVNDRQKCESSRPYHN